MFVYQAHKHTHTHAHVHPKDDKDPKNLILLCTTQGLAVQQDGAGTRKLFHHSVATDGTAHRHWLEAERSAHKVGGAQRETAAEKVHPYLQPPLHPSH